MDVYYKFSENGIYYSTRICFTSSIIMKRGLYGIALIYSKNPYVDYFNNVAYKVPLSLDEVKDIKNEYGNLL